MRIISPFRDYYDSAQGFGADQTRLFLRKPENLAANKLGIPKELQAVCHEVHVWSTATWTAAIIPIVFCGKLYHALRLRYSTYNRTTCFMSETSAVFYTLESAHSWAEAQGNPDLLAFVNRRIKNGELPLASQGTPLNLNWLVENLAPILTCDSQNYESFLTKNACLRDLQFYKMFDAVQAYQELDMYLSGILAAENKPMVEISDKIRALQRGFDCYSFRQPPSKRKAKQCSSKP
jgi:hypothetical protein